MKFLDRNTIRNLVLTVKEMNILDNEINEYNIVDSLNTTNFLKIDEHNQIIFEFV